jgi:uncharacterized damage-inducible protein DinB
MSEVEFIVDQLKRAFDGEAWHGPALIEILAGVDGQTAAAHPIAAGHSIWELVLHISAWEHVVAKRIQGQTPTLSDDENFGHVNRPTEAAWHEAVQTLRTNHDDLVKLAGKLKPAQLNDRVPGKDYDLRSMLIGAVQHAAYHGGQIALLKRARA